MTNKSRNSEKCYIKIGSLQVLRNECGLSVTVGCGWHILQNNNRRHAILYILGWAHILLHKDCYFTANITQWKAISCQIC